MASESPVEALFRLFSPTIKFPGSGDIGSFRYAPYTQWEAPALFRGNEQVEQAVYRDVASPGTQLGALIDAVMVLAAQHASLADDPAIGKLREICDSVNEKKTEICKRTEKNLRREMDWLATNSPDSLQAILKDYKVDDE